jgi:thiamine pyrophosphate-dependent acetolactate synthase large subunit-like protein
MSEPDACPAAKTPAVNRRDVLKASGVGAVSLALLATEAAGAVVADRVGATSIAGKTGAKEGRQPLLPTPLPQSDPPAIGQFQPMERTASDFMVDVLKTLDFEYMCANPSDLFAALHESLTGPYGGNRKPEWITCTHEEIGVAMGHGYYKIEGKPVITSGHSTVGLMHASMAVYNAYCDRVPVYMIFGDEQRPTNHAVLDASAPVRDFIRWYARPESLQALAESAIRAYSFAMTPPTAPVLLAVDFELQERALKGPGPPIPRLSVPQPAEADSGAIAEAARLLALTRNPLIVCDRYARTQAGIDRLVELAELLQAPVLDRGGRMNFPKRHPLNQSFLQDARQLTRDADVVLGLEANMAEFAKSKAKTLSIGADDAFTRGNYQEIGNYGGVDLLMAGDGEASMPALIEAVRRQIDRNQRVAAQARGAKLAEMSRRTFEQARDEARYAWDASPISTARLCAEVWEAVQDEDWSFVSESFHFSRWPDRLWPMEKKYHYNGTSAGGGIGYNAPAALGAALANRKYGRFTVNIQCDGDLMYCPGVLWTAAHHRIPILNVMHNNRAYTAEVMYLRRAANLHGHPLPQNGIGVTLTDPNLSFARIAEGMGVYAEGPIMDPKDLGPALRRAVAVVKRGLPALLDVITQPR